VPYQLSLAVSAGSQNYVNLNVPALNPLVTTWNVMAYDYAGPWSTVSDFLDNLYRGKTKQGVDTDTTLQWYAKNGATKSKINMG
jgi:chitinase